MDFIGIAFYVFAAVSTLYIVHFGFYLTGANLYDIWQFRRLRAYQEPLHMDWPLVTVAISAHNEEKVIVRCLKSIWESTYQNLQVIIVDDASHDDTYKLVRQYIRQHPERNMRVTRKRKNVGKGEALNYALRNHAKGELVMTLDADSILSRDAIANAVPYFDDPRIVGVAANVKIIEEPTIIGMLQKFEHMIGYRSKKIYSLTNCEFVIGGVASTYRMDVLRAVNFYDTDTLTEDIGLSMKIISRGNRANRIVYAADVMAMTEGVLSFHTLLRQRYRWKYGSLQNIVKHYHLIGKNDTQFTWMLTLYRMPMAVISELALLLAPVCWAYVLYLTFNTYSLSLILGAYLTITLYTYITLWADEHTKMPDRLRLSLYVPVAYFIFYVMDFIQFIAIVRCVYRTRDLFTRKNVGGTWVSPSRVGRQIMTE